MSTVKKKAWEIIARLPEDASWNDLVYQIQLRRTDKEGVARSTATQPFQLKVPVVEGTAPPAVDILSREALYDFMDRVE